VDVVHSTCRSSRTALLWNLTAGAAKSFLLAWNSLQKFQNAKFQQFQNFSHASVLKIGGLGACSRLPRRLAGGVLP
jgi:hypothetical protein